MLAEGVARSVYGLGDVQPTPRWRHKKLWLLNDWVFGGLDSTSCKELPTYYTNYIQGAYNLS